MAITPKSGAPSPEVGGLSISGLGADLGSDGLRPPWANHLAGVLRTAAADNILDNAAKYTPTDTHIGVSASHQCSEIASPYIRCKKCRFDDAPQHGF
jgi:hypothetical protein